MGFREFSLLGAALGHAILMVVSFTRAKANVTARAVMVFSLVCFGWNFATFGDHYFGGYAWRGVDVMLSALSPALVLHVVLTFVGQVRTRRTLCIVVDTYFGALALSSMPSILGSDAALRWVESPMWVLLFLAGWLPTFVLELHLLVQHLRRQEEEGEIQRTRLVFVALLIGGVLASTDLWNDLGVPIPSLGGVGTLLSAAILMWVAFHHQLFERDLARAAFLYAAGLILLFGVVLLGAVHWLGNLRGGYAFGVAIALVWAIVLVREIASGARLTRERNTQLVTVGRMTAQMAHELKNPLTAILGAAQVLEGLQDAPGGEAQAFRTLIREQAERMRAILDTYDRLGKVVPVRANLDLHALVKSSIGAQSRQVALTCEGEVRDVELDRDHVATLVENLLNNALAATETKGNVAVRLRFEPRRVTLVVEDTGVGMDARHAEHAFDDFYTTKASGSGLGLAFVRRIAEAHGGDASLVSTLGKGTTVMVRLGLVWMPEPELRIGLNNHRCTTKSEGRLRNSSALRLHWFALAVWCSWRVCGLRAWY